ncbi:hypothetical protein ACFLYH_01025 [Candidatus Dependentiae bacterium]
MKNLKKLFLGIILLSSSLLISLFKISYLAGSHKLYLSGMNLLLPLIGLFAGITNSFLLIPIYFFIKKIAFGGAVTFGIPTLLASTFFALSTKNKNRFLRLLLSIVLPLICMALFVLHSVGGIAYLYSFYWFIPVVLSVLSELKIYKSVFTDCLITTFISHAVGSVIWLYLGNLPAVCWNGLIPVVAVERLIFACGLNVVYIFMNKLFFLCNLENSGWNIQSLWQKKKML